MQAADEFGRQDGGHRAVTDPRKDVELQVPNDLGRVPCRPEVILLGLSVPGAGHQFEGVATRDACALPLDKPRIAGIDPHRQLLGFFPGPLPRRRQRDRRVRPEGDLGRPAEQLVPKEPGLAGWPHPEVQAIAVGKYVFLVALRRRLDKRIVEFCHGVPQKNDCYEKQSGGTQTGTCKQKTNWDFLGPLGTLFRGKSLIRKGFFD